MGDGTYATTGAEVTHTYAAEGTYNVTVRVKRGSENLAQYSLPYTIHDNTGFVNNVLIAEPDLNDKLSYYFYTSVSTNTDNIDFVWDFGDNSETVSTGNINTNVHTFPKYGKTYPVTVTSNIGSNSLDSTVLINIPGVTVDMDCSPSGLTVICRPILPPEIPDMTVKWDCGNGEPPVTTVGDDVVVCEYDETDTNVTVKVEGSDDNLEGTVKDEESFIVSKLFSMQVVEKRATSSDKLSWQITVNGQLESVEGVDISQYKVQYRFDYGDGNGFGQWKDADSNYDIVDTYTFNRYPANNQTGYDVIVQAQVIKTTGLDPEMSSTNTTFNISAPTATLTRTNITNSEGFGQKFCVSWTDYVPAGSLKYTWDFGDQQGTSADGSNGQCQTHVYKNAGKYDITVNVTSNDSKFNTGYVNPVKGSVTFKHTFGDLTGAIQKTADASNPLRYTLTANVNSTSTDGSGGTVGSGALDYAWEITTENGQKVTKTGKSFTYTFPKYGKNYPVNLTVTLKGTDIFTTASEQIAISKPVLKISTNQGIVEVDQQSSWTSSITYNNKDISDIFNPTYAWTGGNAANNNQGTYTPTFNSTGSKTVTLNVTSPQFDGTLTAEGSVEVIENSVLTTFKPNCNNPDEWDTVRFVCTPEFLDQNGKPITDTSSYKVNWKVTELNITEKTNGNAQKELILDWPIDRNATSTPTRDFTVTITVSKNGTQLKQVSQKLTVTRKITYTANIQGYNDNGFNRTAVINFSNVKGPNATGKIRYNWKYNFQNRNGQKVNNTFSTSKNPTSHNFKFVQDQIQYIGSVKGDPFAGGNGIGLQIEGLSKPLTIYGVADRYAVFGPNFTVNTGKSIVFQRRPGNGNMVGITGNKGWWAYAFAHNFKMNEQFQAGSFPYILKVEIQQNANVKHFNSNNGNGEIVSSFTLEKDGMTTSSLYLGFQSDFPPVTFGFAVDVYGYHTSSDANKNGSQFIKMGEAVYQYDRSEQYYSWRF